MANSSQHDETYATYQAEMPFVPNNTMMDASTTTILASATPNNTLLNATIRTLPSSAQPSQGSTAKLTDQSKDVSPTEPTSDIGSTPQATEHQQSENERHAASEPVRNNKTITLRRQISSEDQNKSPVKEKLQKMERYLIF